MSDLAVQILTVFADPALTFVAFTALLARLQVRTPYTS